jgi:serine/threonine protein kinase/tetratricopeptide (TPR) repeat protein
VFFRKNLRKTNSETSLIDFSSTNQSSTERPLSDIGESVAHYKIIKRIGYGGMGEVYLAEDSRLGRRVALKVLSEAFIKDNYRLHRFRSEARAASALNHPNIITIHDIGESGQIHFITTEFIEGETLRQRLSKGRMELTEVLDIALQVASALSASHHAGIVHRDLKPENIMLRTDGYVKLLDFGLAKPSERSQKDGSVVTPIGITEEIRPGIVIGTVSYMSPEQARGQQVDAGTDVFSFGVMLYEMLTNDRPFKGSTTSDVIVEILTKEPPQLDRLNQVPDELKRIVKKCMQKDRQLRYVSASDLLADLQNLKQQLTTGVNALSARTRENILPKLSRSISLGLPILILLIGISYALYLRSKPKPTPFLIKSVAVLPFKSLDAAEDREAIGLKLADAVIQRLGRLHQIIVRPIRAVQKYEGQSLDPVDAGKEQNVDAVFDASFQRAGVRLRVTARLLRVSDSQQLWEGTFEEKSSDPFALQDMLAEQAAEAMLPQLTGADRELIARHDTENVEANRYYTEGRYFWNRRNFEGMRKSIELFENALRLDPNYVRAYAGLADSYITLADNGALTALEAYPKAKQAAEKALSLDSTSFEAYTSMAMVKSNYEWDWAGADVAFRRAIKMNPHYATAHQWYAEFLAGMGRTNEALDHIHKAQELDPLSLIIQSIEASILNYAREYDRAIDQCLRVIQRDPNFAEVYAYQGFAYEQKEMYREAMDAYQKYSALMGRNTPEATAIRTAPVRNAKDYWLKMVELAKPPTGSEFDYALAWSRLGEKEKAISMLEKAAEKRSNNVLYLNVNPNLDPLRSDPKFQALLKHVNLAK